MNVINNFSNVMTENKTNPTKRQKMELIKDKSTLSTNQQHRFNIDFEPFHDEKNIDTTHDKWYTEFNRLLYSKKCVYFYVFLIVFSVAIFIYSLIAYFMNFGKNKFLT
jgi:hypothetical protein